MNGHEFEKWFSDSCAKSKVLAYKLPNTGWQGKTEGRRFTPKNICDFVVHNGEKTIYTELKRRNKSVRFDELSQYDRLMKRYLMAVDFRLEDVVLYGFLIHFANGGTYWVHVEGMRLLKNHLGKKSFNENDIQKMTLRSTHFVRCLEYIPPRCRKPYLSINCLFKDL